MDGATRLAVSALFLIPQVSAKIVGSSKLCAFVQSHQSSLSRYHTTCIYICTTRVGSYCNFSHNLEYGRSTNTGIALCQAMPDSSHIILCGDEEGEKQLASLKPENTFVLFPSSTSLVVGDKMKWKYLFCNSGRTTFNNFPKYKGKSKEKKRKGRSKDVKLMTMRPHLIPKRLNLTLKLHLLLSPLTLSFLMLLGDKVFRIILKI